MLPRYVRCPPDAGNTGKPWKRSQRHYPLGTLIAPPEFRPAIKQGIADIGFAVPYKWDEKFTIATHITALLWAKDTATTIKIYDDIWKEFPELMAAEWEDYKVLWLGPAPPTFFGTMDKPVRKMEDFKGLQIRAPSKGEVAKLNLLGATPVVLSTPDYVLGLEKGTVDGGCMAYMESHGVEFTYLSPEEKARWDAAIAPAFDDIVADMNAKGLPGQEIVQFVLDRNDYYATQ